MLSWAPTSSFSSTPAISCTRVSCTRRMRSPISCAASTAPIRSPSTPSAAISPAPPRSRATTATPSPACARASPATIPRSTTRCCWPCATPPKCRAAKSSSSSPTARTTPAWWRPTTSAPWPKTKAFPIYVISTTEVNQGSRFRATCSNASRSAPAARPISPRPGRSRWRPSKTSAKTWATPTPSRITRSQSQRRLPQNHHRPDQRSRQEVAHPQPPRLSPQPSPVADHCDANAAQGGDAIAAPIRRPQT